jgi:hypothetical protein
MRYFLVFKGRETVICQCRIASELIKFDEENNISICRFVMRSKRWMLAYINGLTEEQRELAEKQYKSHRRRVHIMMYIYSLSLVSVFS